MSLSEPKMLAGREERVFIHERWCSAVTSLQPVMGREKSKFCGQAYDSAPKVSVIQDRPRVIIEPTSKASLVFRSCELKVSILGDFIDLFRRRLIRWDHLHGSSRGELVLQAEKSHFQVKLAQLFKGGPRRLNGGLRLNFQMIGGRITSFLITAQIHFL